MKRICSCIFIFLLLFFPSIARGFTYETKYDVLNMPTSVTIDPGGKIYAADYGNNRIVILNPDLTFSAEKDFNILPVNYPVGYYIRFDPVGNFYMTINQGPYIDSVINMGSNWDESGSKYGKSGTGSKNFSLNSIYGIFVTQDDLYIADTGNNRVVKFDFASGNPSYISSLSLNSPFAVAADSSGNIYITDTNNHRMVKLDGSLIYVSEFGVTGVPANDSSHLYLPSGIYVDNLGSIYIADTGNKRIIKLDHKFNYVTEFDETRDLGNPASHLISPVDVTVDNNYNVYVVDSSNHIIIKMSQIVLLTASLPDAIKGEAYQSALDIYGNAGALTWSVESGSLPDGVTLTDGILSGAPTVEGTYDFVLKVTDANDTDLREYTLKVASDSGGGNAGSGKGGGASPANDSGGSGCFINNLFIF